MKERFTLTSRGLNETDEAVLKSLLSLFENRLPHEWRYADSIEQSDLIIIDLDNSEGKRQWEALRGNESIAITGFARDIATMETTYKLQKPLRLQQLSRLLRQIGTQRSSRNRRAVTHKPESDIPSPNQQMLLKTTGPEAEKPFFQWLGIIGHQHSGPVRASLGELSVWIHPAEHESRSRFELNELTPLCKAKLKSLILEPTTTFKANEKPFKFPALVWYSALVGSNRRLLDELNEKDGYTLSRWPDFEHLPRVPDHYRLAAYLSKHTARLPELREAINVSENSLVSFLNAAYVCGYLNKRMPQASPQGPKPAESHEEENSLLEKIRERLGMTQKRRTSS